MVAVLLDANTKCTCKAITNFTIENKKQLLKFFVLEIITPFFFNWYFGIFEDRFECETQVQWNLDLTKCQGTGEICSLYQGFVRFHKFLGKQAKCSLY